jgi:hypothetical protein
MIYQVFINKDLSFLENRTTKTAKALRKFSGECLGIKKMRAAKSARWNVSRRKRQSF